MPKEKQPINEPTIEITRSYSQKVNLGNYETKDSFCSAKIECLLSEVEEKSKMLDIIVKEEVRKSIEGNQPKEIPNKPTNDTSVIEEILKFESEI